MWLQSEVGRGSTFGFSVPSGLPEIAARTSRPAGSAPLVVMIEDDRASLELASAYLEGTGIEVLKTRNGREGLDRVQQLKPAAVLLDIRLPGIDGWSLLRRFSSEPEICDIPVIVLSIVDERARGLAMGASAYLIKPVSRDDLLAALTTAGVLPIEPGPVQPVEV
jgi:CheY-like chemotaxis protein